MEIKENTVYTTKEVQEILKISQSTFMRLIKRGNLPAAKVGGQYRILGRDLLSILASASAVPAVKP